MSSNMLKRVGFAVVAIPAVVGLVWLGGWALALALAVLGVLGTGEVYGLARRQGLEPLVLPGLIAAAAIPLVTAWAWLGPWAPSGRELASVAALALLGLPLLAMRRGVTGRPLAAVAVTAFGAVYASGTLAFLIPLRAADGPASPLGRAALVLLPLVLTWLCDTAAMLAGSLAGGAKLAPVLSPRKTRVGGVAGAVVAVTAAVVLGRLVLVRLGWSYTALQWALVGLAVGLLGQAGDIAESLFKREAGVKDSSTVIPGHGGVLDRLDSLYYVIPVSAALYWAYGLGA